MMRVRKNRGARDPIEGIKRAPLTIIYEFIDESFFFRDPSSGILQVAESRLKRGRKSFKGFKGEWLGGRLPALPVKVAYMTLN
jgi:hypothetical protein